MDSQDVRPWQEPGYGDIVSALADEEGAVEVSFANGDLLTVSRSRLGLPEGPLELAVDPEEPGCVLVRVSNEPDRELSWITLRSAGDQVFAQEMRRRDAEESRRIGRRLKALREDRGLSQKDLAGMMGMSAPQLSKIETGIFDLRVSTLQSLLRAMGASFSDISGEAAPETSQKVIRQNARKAGVAPETLDRLFANLDRRSVPAALERLLGWARNALDAPPPDGLLIDVPIAFKGADPADTLNSPQLTMAIRVSELVCAAFRGPDPQGNNLEVAAIRKAVTKPTEGVALAALVGWVLKAGIPVIPLWGRGVFSAATWQVDNRPCIVLKETRDFCVFWLFDIAHELGHLAKGHLAEGWLVDIDEPRPVPNSDWQEEEANAFALDLLLPDHQELLRRVRAESRGNYLRFKGAVESVANHVHVSPGLLGMVAAYELGDIGEAKDRWGSATNLARVEGSGRAVVAKALWEHIDLRRLTDLDVSTLTALVGP